MSGTLYVVATPIGNLSEMSPRAVETLRFVDLIAAEDTRVTGKLCQAFGIRTPLTSCHQHNENGKAAGKTPAAFLLHCFYFLTRYTLICGMTTSPSTVFDGSAVTVVPFISTPHSPAGSVVETSTPVGFTYASATVSPPTSGPPRHAEAGLPEFTPGAERALFRLSGEGDDLRLEFRPAGARGVAYRER